MPPGKSSKDRGGDDRFEWKDGDVDIEHDEKRSDDRFAWKDGDVEIKRD